MPRVVSFLNDEIMKNIKELYKDSDKSLSRIISELVDIGYKVKQHHETQQTDPIEKRKAELKDKHTEYLLRIMAVTTDIYRCIRNEKSKYNEELIDEVLDTIVTNARIFINGQSENK